jgi:hypothetical protein
MRPPPCRPPSPSAGLAFMLCSCSFVYFVDFLILQAAPQSWPSRCGRMVLWPALAPRKGCAQPTYCPCDESSPIATNRFARTTPCASGRNTSHQLRTTIATKCDEAPAPLRRIGGGHGGLRPAPRRLAPEPADGVATTGPAPREGDGKRRSAARPSHRATWPHPHPPGNVTRRRKTLAARMMRRRQSNMATLPPKQGVIVWHLVAHTAMGGRRWSCPGTICSYREALEMK